MRIKLTTTINAAGQLSNICITVKGLNTKELPIRDDSDDSRASVVVKEIPGFAISTLFDCTFEVKGFIAFLRSDGNADETTSVQNFKKYHEKVYMTFINENRASVCRSLSIKDDIDQVPEYLTACGWIDGATDQLAALC
eukprot:10746294-Ditylum_brightwellii.AAC.1